MSDDSIEAEIQAKGLTAPRVTPDQIDNLLNGCDVICQVVPGTTTTVATVVDANGFTICSEISACASPENFDKELGEKIATDRALKVARDELWRLEGYLLKRKLAEGGAQ
ncbi:hypothetical protein HBA55_29605 [Pseudomaricurvus alkylphenolicus]|nr:hypothetical protein [Pseudomaricurvus alkylphenolicus]